MHCSKLKDHTPVRHNKLFLRDDDWMDMPYENSDNSTASAVLPICPTMVNPCSLSGSKPNDVILNKIRELTKNLMHRYQFAWKSFEWHL